MTSIFKQSLGDEQLIMCIHTDNERDFALLVEGGGRRYKKGGFTSWFDAYDHGQEVLLRSVQ